MRGDRNDSRRALNILAAKVTVFFFCGTIMSLIGKTFTPSPHVFSQNTRFCSTPLARLYVAYSDGKTGVVPDFRRRPYSGCHALGAGNAAFIRCQSHFFLCGRKCTAASRCFSTNNKGRTRCGQSYPPTPERLENGYGYIPPKRTTMRRTGSRQFVSSALWPPAHCPGYCLKKKLPNRSVGRLERRF